MSEQTTMSDEYGVMAGPRDVRFERLLPGPIERVWTYLTDPDLRARWLAGGSMDQKAGGRVELKFRHAELSPDETPPEPHRNMHETGHVQVGEVLACEPPRLLTITWGGSGEGPSEVTFELTPQGDEVLLTLTHRRLADRAEMLNVAGGWHTHLGILEDRLAGRAARPFWATWQGLVAGYDQRLPKDL
jgi:uncharacterized protein YndB with AHSA1/START domain